MKTYLLIFSFLFLAILGSAQTQSIEQPIAFSSSVPQDSFFISTPISIHGGVESPFLYLSAYSKVLSFNGILMVRTFSDQQWSGWQVLEAVPSEENADRIAFQGKALSNNIDSIQFKTTERTLLPIHYRLFFPQPSANKQREPSSQRGNELPCVQPEFCDRDCWCPNGNCPTDPTPVETTVTHIIVHHSAGNSVSDDFPAVVRSIWDFHANTRGWDDIGYNWLIDANGVIYEGRGEERLGAHFSCMNEATVGICLIGNFEEAEPTEAALAALHELVDWEAHKGAIEVDAAGYHVSSQLELDFVAGHRDGGASLLACSSTVCPGENLYSELPRLRASIAAFPCIPEEDMITDVEEVRLFYNTQLFPNPSKGIVHLSFHSSLTTQSTISLINLNGNSFDLGKRMIQYGENTISFQSPTVESGIYFLQLKAADIMIKKQLVIVN